MAVRKRASEARLIAVDWGTSRLRATLLDAGDGVIAEAESGDGIGGLAPGGHEAALERLVAGWGPAPAIMAGMVGSRQGWHETPYLAAPVTPEALAKGLLRFEAAGRKLAIVPGAMHEAPGEDGDVMRGEETQIVGLIESEPGFAGTAVLPGTHSKWARVEGGAIVRFRTFMSGELFDLLAHRSFLRHSVAEADAVAARPGFAAGVRRMTEDGVPFAAALFGVRTRQLLEGIAEEENFAYLSGLVIGGEIAAARTLGLLDRARDIRIAAAAGLASAYGAALGIAGHKATAKDGGALAVKGLARLARESGFAEGG